MQIHEMQKQVQLLQSEMQISQANLTAAQSVPCKFDLSEFASKSARSAKGSVYSQHSPIVSAKLHPHKEQAAWTL